MFQKRNWSQFMKKLGVLTSAGSMAAAVATAGGSLPPGTEIPDLKAKNQEGQWISLKNFRGKPILLYFYPKDDTPGCTKQACDLRDRHGAFQKAGAVIFGVSRQDEASHKAFKAKYRLPFDLLSDPDGTFAEALGVETYPVVGFHKRQSLLIDPRGRLYRFYGDVDPATHAEAVLHDLLTLEAQGKPQGK